MTELQKKWVIGGGIGFVVLMLLLYLSGRRGNAGASVEPGAPSNGGGSDLYNYNYNINLGDYPLQSPVYSNADLPISCGCPTQQFLTAAYQPFIDQLNTELLKINQAYNKEVLANLPTFFTQYIDNFATLALGATGQTPPGPSPTHPTPSEHVLS